MQRRTPNRHLAAAAALAISLLSACSGSTGDSEPSAGPAAAAPAPPATTVVGSPIDTATAVAIDSAGGEAGTPGDELVVSIPAGALASATDIGIQPITNAAPGGIGSAYRLTPDGLKFSQPVKVTFSYSGLDLGGTPAAALGVATQTADKTWQLLANAVIDEDAETVTVATTHFTDFSLLEGFQIRPPSTVVGEGNKVVLNVRYCFDPNGPTQDESGDVLAGFVYQCDIESTDPDLTPLVLTPNVLAWYVNGIKGGNGTVGTIAGNSRASAVYTAPAMAPDPSTVAASAELAWKKGGKLLVTASIDVTGGLSYKGPVTYTVTGGDQSFTVTGDVVWTDTAPTGPREAKVFTASGMLDATITVDDCNPFRGSVPIEGTLYFNVPGDGLYSFDLGTQGSDAVLSCNGVPVPYGTLTTSPPCSPPRLGDGDVLKGSGSCTDGATLEWNFKRID